MSTSAWTAIEVFLVMVGGFVAVAYMGWFYSRSAMLLEHWAKSNGYEILHSEIRNFSRGPFFVWRCFQKRNVYYVKIRDQNGNERSGWVCCGGLWTGQSEVKIEVQWEDKPLDKYL